MSDGKRRTATAGGRGIRIAHHELGAFQTLCVIYFRAHKVLVTHGVNNEGHIAVDYRDIALADLFVKLEAILETGTSAAGYVDSQFEIRIIFLCNQSGIAVAVSFIGLLPLALLNSFRMKNYVISRVKWSSISRSLSRFQPTRDQNSPRKILPRCGAPGCH